MRTFFKEVSQYHSMEKNILSLGLKVSTEPILVSPFHLYQPFTLITTVFSFVPVSLFSPLKKSQIRRSRVKWLLGAKVGWGK